MLKLAVFFLCLLTTVVNAAGMAPLFAWNGAAAAYNSKASIGTNLAVVSYFSTEQPFANILSNQSNWGTLNNADLSIDANGWITSLSSPNSVTVSMLLNNSFNSPYYTAGTYDIYFTGTCTFTVGLDGGSLSPTGSNSTGHATFNVATPSSNGIQFDITEMGSGNDPTTGYCRNISITPTALTSAYRTGCNQFTGGSLNSACFNPKFLQNFKAARSYRFMDWMCTNSNTNATASSSWANRPGPAMPFFGSDVSTPGIPCGVPVEFISTLCNVQNTDCHVNMPTLAIDNYVTGFATAMSSGGSTPLNSNLHAFVEYANETWNFGFDQFSQLIAIGAAAGSTVYLQDASQDCGDSNSDFCNRSVMGHLSQHFCSLWKTAFGGSSSQVNCVLAAQAASTTSVTQAISCVSYIGDVAISSGTYNSGTGAVSLTLNSSIPAGFASGSSFSAGFIGTGSATSLNTNSGTATTGTTGTTLNFTAATGLTLAITGGNVGFHNCLGNQIGFFAIAPYFGAEMPISITASNVGTGDGGLTILFEEQNSGGYLPTTSSCTTGGTATAFTCTTGMGLSTTPANGFCIGVTWNQTPTSGLSDTIAIDTIGAISLLNNVGGDPSTYAFQGAPQPICYTSSTSSGSVTPAWRVIPNLGYSPGGWLGLAHSWTASYVSLISASYPSIKLIAYEGGQSYSDPVNTATELTTLYSNANLDSRMGASYTTDYTYWSQQTGTEIFNNFDDVGINSKFGNWSLIQNNCETDCTLGTTPNDPKFQAWVSFNTTVACWWSDCSH